MEPIRNVCVNNFKAIGNCVWTIFPAGGPFGVEQAQKVISASKLTPWVHGGCIKIAKHAQSGHTAKLELESQRTAGSKTPGKGAAAAGRTKLLLYCNILL